MRRSDVDGQRPVLRWPYIGVPDPDGTVAVYRLACSPWADDIAAKQVGGRSCCRTRSSKPWSVSSERLSISVGWHFVVSGIGEGKPDPREPTRDWRLWPQVDLVSPPGDPLNWKAHVDGTSVGVGRLPFDC